ncbi:MAG: chitobiase/beta-hexosaminidase C-terminal domain-containing protein [Methanobacterium sp. ERen5]|nr:MAG: chitobiase/beta-hexosaminidase C-terminal domain-containing protein [Methanobacterium sp. ERen5]
MIRKAIFLAISLLVIMCTSGLVSATSNTNNPTALFVNCHVGNNSYTGTSQSYQGGNIGPKATINAALNIVQNNGNINIASGTYNETLNIGHKSLTMNGYGSNTIITGNNAPYISLSTSSACYFNNLTFQGGSSNPQYGGAVYQYSGQNTFTNCNFNNNQAGYGGAIFQSGGYITLNQCTFQNNQAYNGGAIENEGGTLTVTGCVFNHNIAYDSTYGDGGAINIRVNNRDGSTVTIQNNLFSGNRGIGSSICSQGPGIIWDKEHVNVNYNAFLDSGTEVMNWNGGGLGDTSIMNVDNNWWGQNSIPSNALSGASTSTYLILAQTTINGNTTGITLNTNNQGQSIPVTESPISGYINACFKAYYGNGTITTTNTLINKGFARYIINGNPVYLTGTVNNQSINMHVHSINHPAPQITSNIKSGVYNTKKTVRLKTVSNTTTKTYYTVDGTNPQKSSTKKLYKRPITINTTTLLKYSAVNLKGTWSPIYTKKYIIDKKVPKVVPSHGGKVYVNTTFKIRFNKKIHPSNNYKSIFLKNRNTGKLVKISKSIKGNILIIKHSKLHKNTKYTLYIPKNSFKDDAGNQLKNVYISRFKTTNFKNRVSDSSSTHIDRGPSDVYITPGQNASIKLELWGNSDIWPLDGYLDVASYEEDGTVIAFSRIETSDLGETTYKIGSSLTPGQNHKIEFVYEGDPDQGYDPCTNNIMLHINYPTCINMTSIQKGKTVYLSAKLWNNYNMTPLVNKNITFSVTDILGRILYTGTDNTDSNGNAVLSYQTSTNTDLFAKAHYNGEKYIFGCDGKSLILIENSTKNYRTTVHQ